MYKKNKITIFACLYATVGLQIGLCASEGSGLSSALFSLLSHNPPALPSVRAVERAQDDRSCDRYSDTRAADDDRGVVIDVKRHAAQEILHGKQRGWNDTGNGLQSLPFSFLTYEPGSVAGSSVRFNRLEFRRNIHKGGADPKKVAQIETTQQVYKFLGVSLATLGSIAALYKSLPLQGVAHKAHNDSTAGNSLPLWSGLMCAGGLLELYWIRSAYLEKQREYLSFVPIAQDSSLRNSIRRDVTQATGPDRSVWCARVYPSEAGVHLDCDEAGLKACSASEEEIARTLVWDPFYRMTQEGRGTEISNIINKKVRNGLLRTEDISATYARMMKEANDNARQDMLGDEYPHSTRNKNELSRELLACAATVQQAKKQKPVNMLTWLLEHGSLRWKTCDPDSAIRGDENLDNSIRSRIFGTARALWHHPLAYIATPVATGKIFNAVGSYGSSMLWPQPQKAPFGAASLGKLAPSRKPVIPLPDLLTKP